MSDDAIGVADPQAVGPTGICKLCTTPSVLRWSHIVPRWVYRRVVRTGDPKRPTPIQVSNKVAVVKSDQAAEYMLCTVCEDLLHHDETYAAEVTIQEDGTFPALAAAKVLHSDGRLRVADIAALRVDALVRLAVSIVWRASVSTKFPHLRLGKYEPELAAFVRGESALPKEVGLLFWLLDSPTGVGRVLYEPASRRDDGYHVHRVAFFGFDIMVYVGRLLPSFLADHCLARTNRVIISDGADQYEQVASAMASSERKGRLAREYGRFGRPSRRN